MKLSRVVMAAHAAVTVVLAQFPLPALAAEGGAPARSQGERTPLDLSEVEPTQAGGSGGGGGFLRTMIGLLIVIAVIYGLYWVLKQVKSSREERASGQGLSTIATLPLGPGRSLHMVRAGHEVVLLGVGEHGVTPVRSYAEGEAVEAGLLEPDDGDQNGGSPGAPPTAARSGAGNGAQPSFPAATDAVRQAIDTVRRRTVRG